MSAKKYFYLDESPVHPGGYIIKVDFDVAPVHHTTGSFSILPARLMHLQWADYLRMCRDMYHAKLYGKNTMYPVAVFHNEALAMTLVKTLNARMEYILSGHRIVDMRENLKNQK